MPEIKPLTLIASLAALLACQQENDIAIGADIATDASQVSQRAVAQQVLIRGGTFIMGDFGAVGKDGVWRPYFPPTAEKNTAHEVTLSDYSIAKHKTTWFEFDTFLLATQRPVVLSLHGQDIPREPYSESVDDWTYVTHPAEVTWQQAKDYCAWLAEKTGAGFDLPTSAQWEFAARNRGSTQWLYPTNDGLPIDESSPYGGGTVGPVGTRVPPNPLGLYDMAENAEEWVNDWYSETYYAESDGAIDPTGPAGGEGRVLRSLGTGSLSFSFSYRMGPEREPDGFVYVAGFRCAIDEPKGGTK